MQICYRDFLNMSLINLIYSRKTPEMAATEIRFQSLLVQGGGRLILESVETVNTDLLILSGDTLEVQSGGVVELNQAKLKVKSCFIHQAGLITAHRMVSCLNG